MWANILEPLFAEEGAPVWLTASLIPMATLLGGGIVWLLQWWAGRRDAARAAKAAERDAAAKRQEADEKQQSVDRKTTLDEWREIVGRQDLQLKSLQEGHELCRKREMALQRMVVYLHGLTTRMADRLREAGIKVETVTPLEALGIGEFGEVTPADRQLAQGTILLHDEAKQAGAPVTPSDGAK